MSSWVELEQRHKQREKGELKDKIMQMSCKIKALELSFKETLDTLNNNNESFILRKNDKLDIINREKQENIEKPFINTQNKGLYKEYLLESKLRYFIQSFMEKTFIKTIEKP